MRLSKRLLTKHLHGKLLPDQVDRHSGYATTRAIIRTGLSTHLATPGKKHNSRETIASILSGKDERSIGEKIAYAAYCSFMRQSNMLPIPYSGWKVGNRVANASTDLRRPTKGRWLQIRDKHITVGSTVIIQHDPNSLLKVTSIRPDCMVIVKDPGHSGTFSITPEFLVKITLPSR